MLLKNDNAVSEEVSALLLSYYGISGEVYALQGEVDLNFYVKSDVGDEYAFKIGDHNADHEEIVFQNALMAHARGQTTVKLPYPIKSVNGREIEFGEYQNKERSIRLLSWVPGRLFAHVNPHHPDLLYNIGEACGELCRALHDFDHPGAHKTYKWDPAQAFWVKKHIAEFEDADERDLVLYFYSIFEDSQPLLSSLRKSVTHNDVNDYNIVVSQSLENPRVEGIIDFGDAVHTYTVNELAIALAYAMMGKEDPVQAAVHVIKGFHAKWKLQEEEVEALLPLIGARLIISVTSSMLNKKEHPENEYLLISERPAWKLLKILRDVPQALIHYFFRSACGWSAFPAPLLPTATLAFEIPVDVPRQEKIYWLDLSVSSLELGSSSKYESALQFKKHIDRTLEDAGSPVGIGRYGEARPFYTGPDDQSKTDDGLKWKALHLGLDFFVNEEAEVRAVHDGKVHSWSYNDNENGKGPTIILEHDTEGVIFYSLYSHLSIRSLEELVEGQYIKKGEVIGHVGNEKENGGWPTHLHFQLIRDMLNYKGLFTNASAAEEWEVWQQICPDPSPFFGWKPSEFIPEDTLQILDRRQKVLGKSLSVSYHDPLHIVRGYKQHLFDNHGRRYLDMVNNVAHVGHEHPAVVEAGQRQMAVLNTNTRYLHTELVKFAEELLSTLPSHLKVCHFVNSGSEANELALRMVRAYSGQRDMIALESGYHGNTGGCIDISSYKFDGKGGKGAPEYTHVVPVPDYYRGLYHQSITDRLSKYISHVEDAIDRVKKKGRSVGGFIAESILSCAGQIVLPDGYLTGVYPLIHAEGGICIADEVQVGVGRVGEKYWGFELQGVKPDIVTIGKPLGNGHPLAAVVCTEEVAGRFNNGMEYFNTFGGNPVSCSIGRAVLKTVREEKLQRNALEVGNLLLHELQLLKSQYPLIGDVRGCGLFLGFELIREEMKPATREASYLANRMKDKGVLMSTDGPDNNVLKLKPPICFNRHDAVFFLEQLEEVLKEDFLKV